MSITREYFVECFGEILAERLEVAATEHTNDEDCDKGSDFFRWVLMITAAKECFIGGGGRAQHRIEQEASGEEIEFWIRQFGGFSQFDGSFDEEFDLEEHEQERVKQYYGTLGIINTPQGKEVEDG